MRSSFCTPDRSGGIRERRCHRAPSATSSPTAVRRPAGLFTHRSGRAAAYEAAVKPLEHYLDRVRHGEPASIRLRLQWLVAWAEGDAMLGKIEKEQAHYERNGCRRDWR